MSKKALVIVESPSKAKTIQKYLGREYIVKASVGHIKDLPKSKLGVDLEKGLRAGLPAHSLPRPRSSRSFASSPRTSPSSTSRLTRTAKAKRSPGTSTRSSKPRARKFIASFSTPSPSPRFSRRWRIRRSSNADKLSRPAGAPRARSPGGLQDQPAALGQGEARDLRRPRAVRRAAPGRRPRSRDQGVQARGILDSRRHFFEGRHRLRQPTSSRPTAKIPSFPTKARSTSSSASLKGANWKIDSIEQKERSRKPHGSVHHLAACSKRPRASSASAPRKQ